MIANIMYENAHTTTNIVLKKNYILGCNLLKAANMLTVLGICNAVRSVYLASLHKYD